MNQNTEYSHRDSLRRIQNTECLAPRPALGVEIARLAIEYADAKVPFEHRGTSRNGCDCTGLLIGICRELGYLKDYELRDYPYDWNLHAGASNYVIDELTKYAVEVPRSEAAVGDIAVMRIGKCPAHCGIIVAPGPVIVHSLVTSKYCRKSVLRNSQWSERWIKTFRFCEAKLSG